MNIPSYTPEILARLACQTEDIEDHNKLIKLYQDLHKQGDIDFNDGLKDFVKDETHYFRFVKNINEIQKLCIFCLRLVDLQEKGFAHVTALLNRRITFQRELIIAKNQDKH